MMAFNDPPPKGTCDICRTKKARYWFGQTSVALCGDEACERINQSQWNAMIEEMEREQDE
jgi:hypothetical protein